VRYLPFGRIAGESIVFLSGMSPRWVPMEDVFDGDAHVLAHAHSESVVRFAL